MDEVYQISRASDIFCTNIDLRCGFVNCSMFRVADFFSFFTLQIFKPEAYYSRKIHHKSAEKSAYVPTFFKADLSAE